MKPTLLALLLAGTAVAVGQPTYQVPAPRAEVQINTEVGELARGYAAALSRIHHTPIYMTLRQGGNIVTLVSIKSLKAVDGVLVVELDTGPKYIINPKDIITITDAPPTKP